MGSWIDRAARRAAGQAAQNRPEPPPVQAPRPAPLDSSRRDFLKRAGVVGAAVWTVPVIESALAPAAAASTPTCTNVCGGACPTCGLGKGPCTQNAQCSSGLVCSGGVCKTAQGGTCTINANCSTNVCINGTCRGTVAGSTCAAWNTCLSYICDNSGHCFKSIAGWYCLSSADCYTSGGCNAASHTCNTSAHNGKCMLNSDCTGNYTCQGEDWNTFTLGTCR
jgi:hypothetical protein